MTWLAYHKSTASDIDRKDDLGKTPQIIGNRDTAILGTFLMAR
jgi:hypothetical protein